MRVIVNLLIVFILTYILLYFKCPDINNTDFIKQKAILFAIIYSLQVVLELIDKIIQKCKIDINEIASDALYTATAAVIGFSIYNDIVLKKLINQEIPDFFHGMKGSNRKNYVYITLFITLGIASMKFSKIITSYQSNICKK